jgi:hypothetical protein
MSNVWKVLVMMPTAVLASVVDGQSVERRNLAGQRVALYNLAGRVTVEGGSGSDVTVEIRRGGRDASRLRIETGPIEGRETLRVLYPADRVVYTDSESRGRSRTDISVREDGTWGGDWGSRRDRVEVATWGDGMEAWADLVVRVPSGKAFDLNLGVGSATVTNVNGDVSVDVHAATIRTSGTRGRLDLDAGSGEVEVKDAQGELTLDAGSGGVSLENISGAELTIDAGSGSVRGRGITVDAVSLDAGAGGVRLLSLRARTLEIDSGSGPVELDLLSDVDRLSLDVGSGGVTLGIPESLGAEVRVETGSGGIDLDVPIQMTRQGRRYFAGRLGDGRGEISIEAGSGSVRFRRSGASDR